MIICNDLGARPWFSRVWTIQEFQLSNHRCIVQCGHATLSRRCLRMACTRLVDFEFHAHDSRFQGRVGEMVLSIADMTPDPWSCILGRASEKRCTDPRDKMYGILGLLRGTTLAIQPSYTAPVVEIYRTAMLQHVPICGAFGSPGSWLLGTTNCLVPLRGCPTGEWGATVCFMSHNGRGGFSFSSWTQPNADTLCVEDVRLGAITATSPLLPTVAAFVDLLWRGCL